MSKKTKKINIISLIMSVSIFFNSLTVFANDISQEIIDDEIAVYIENQYLAEETKTIDEIKHIKGFNGGTLIVLECKPEGYFIVDQDSKVILEYNLYAQSPYENIDENNAYYGGVTCYYEKKETSYTHTILDETLTNFEQKQAEENCNMIQESIEKNELVGKNTSKNDYWVRDYTWFAKRAGNFGYYCPENSEGICGYVAANMILKYWRHLGAMQLPNPYANMGSTDLVKKLRSYGKSDDSYGWSIADVMNSFCRDYRLPEKASWSLGIIGVNEEIKTYKRPCILFGLFHDTSGAKTGGHAIVVYGYNDYENPMFYTYICHLGWESDEKNNYSEVHVSGAQKDIFGSNTKYKISFYK